MPKKIIQSITAETSNPTTFEDGLNELSTLVTAMESGDTSLADMLIRYQRGTLLLKFCETQLTTAQQQLLELDINGQLTPLNLI
ncbi:MAG: Exodeoxyribonuclease [Pseudomonadota bacterium]|jgi:exodeoxyribonuclease VII small subunit